CNTEPDFSLVVCCKACSDVTVSYRERGALFFNTQNDSSLCFDRMSSGYCSRFQSNADAWSGKRSRSPVQVVVQLGTLPARFSRVSTELRLLHDGLAEVTGPVEMYIVYGVK
ncbi:hypothetical protein ANCDUO_26665, partial [Ancylostoma duodenale]